MKLLGLALFASLYSLTARGEDWTTKDGKTYKDVTVISHDAKVVTISAADGPATFPISLLSNDVQKRVNEDHVTAKDWTTTDGKTYTNVEVLKHDEVNVTILDSDGGAIIPLQNLPADLQQKFGYDPVKLKAEAREKAIEEKAAQEARATEARESALAFVKDNTKTIKEVETDQASFVGRKFIIRGTIALDTYYNFGYQDCSITHYSFCIRQGDHVAYAYLPKDAPIANQLRKGLLASDDPLDGLFTVEIDPNRFDRDCETLMVLLLDYAPSVEDAAANAPRPEAQDQGAPSPPPTSKSDQFTPGSINEPVHN